MGFKEYIKESYDTDVMFKHLMWDGYIPISPKFFKELFGDKGGYCFMTIDSDRVSSLSKRQGKKNQMSTFTKWTNTDIFWGAWGFNWKYNDNNEINSTYVAVLKGKISLESNTELWSDFETKSGRRWVSPDVPDSSFKNDFTSVLLKISDELKNFIRNKFSYIDDPKDFLSFKNEYKYELIKEYMDLTYKLLKKYKNELSKAVQKTSSKYNEVLCYDYKVQELLIYQGASSTTEAIESAKKQNIKYKIFTDIGDLEKALKNYQKKNKGQ
jgi:hypothetical protein